MWSVQIELGCSFKEPSRTWITGLSRSLYSISLALPLNVLNSMQECLTFIRYSYISLFALHPFKVWTPQPATKNGWYLQYDGSNDDLDWRIDFRYPDFICIMKFLRSRLIKGCTTEWKYLRLSNFKLRLDLFKTSFFKVYIYLNRLGGKF